MAWIISEGLMMHKQISQSHDGKNPIKQNNIDQCSLLQTFRLSCHKLQIESTWLVLMIFNFLCRILAGSTTRNKIITIVLSLSLYLFLSFSQFLFPLHNSASICYGVFSLKKGWASPKKAYIINWHY